MLKRVTTLAAALACLAAPAAAHAQEAFSVRPLEIDVLTGPDNDTTCNVKADLYTPAGLSGSRRAPAILATNGFGGSKADFSSLAPAYARRGYVFLAYSGLGFGGSGCKIQLDDPDWDGKAGSQLVSFLAGTKAANDGTRIDYVEKDAPGDPRVGMIGGSYGGQIQFAIAGLDPRLDTIVPQITWNDLAYSLVPNNTDFAKGVTYNTPGVAKLDWPALFTALGLSGIQQVFTEQDPSHLGQCPNFDDRVCRGLVLSGSLGYAVPETLELLRHASVASYMDDIRIPVFLSQGQSDTLFNLQEAVATYQALRAQRVPVKMLWRSAGHSGGGIAGESNSTDLEKAYESRLALEWFDFWLRGLGDAPKLDFSFLRDWTEYSGDAAPAVGVTPTYPAGTDTPLYLSAGSALVDDRAKAQAGSAPFLASPVPAGNGSGYTTLPVPDAPGLGTDFTGAPLADDLDVVGVPRVRLKLDAPTFAQAQAADPAARLVLFAKLYDVDPATGDETLPREQLSAVRVADVTKPVEIELPGIAYRFRKGHRLRLRITTGNATSRGNSLAGPVTITLDPSDPSVLTLPRLGEQAGPTGGAPSGLTAFRPARGAPAPQTAQRPAFARDAARLPSARRCASRRRFTIRLRKARRGDRIRSATVTVNGRRARVVRGRRLRARIDLRGLPKGTVRVMVTVRTAKGRVHRSARTYRTCVSRRR